MQLYSSEIFLSHSAHGRVRCNSERRLRKSDALTRTLKPEAWRIVISARSELRSIYKSKAKAMGCNFVVYHITFCAALKAPEPSTYPVQLPLIGFNSTTAYYICGRIIYRLSPGAVHASQWSIKRHHNRYTTTIQGCSLVSPCSCTFCEHTRRESGDVNEESSWTSFAAILRSGTHQ